MAHVSPQHCPPNRGKAIAYANQAISASAISLNVSLNDGQFVHCETCLTSQGQGSWSLNNLLFAKFVAAMSMAFANISAKNATFDGNVLLVPAGTANTVTLNLTNCIVANAYSFMAGSPGTIGGGYNGFYNNGSAHNATFGIPAFTSSSTPFQTVGAGNYYLSSGSGFQNMGVLVSGLNNKTTYPPLVYTNATIYVNTNFTPQAARDISGTPDLGYHYDPIDYYTEQYTIVSATLTISGGAVIACNNDNGIWLGGGSAINCIGTDTKPNWLTYYLCVQEEPVALGPYYPFTVCPDAGGGVKPVGVFQFTKFAGLAGRGNELYDEDGGYFYGSLLIQNCEFWNGWIELNGPGSSTTLVQNNLFARAPVDAVDHYYSYDGNYSLSFSNNLFWHLAFEVDQNSTGEGVFFNNDFDSCGFSYGGSNASTTNGYNAYLNCSGRLSPTNANDIVTNVSLAYQTGLFGDFYQPTNSPLIDKGSTTAIAAGLSSLTTQTNQTLDTGTVDIGYHYPVIIGSTGTDFWLAFCGLFVQTDPTQIDYDANDLMLYISGPVGATGTVTGLGLRVNDSTVIVTNCGDAAVNGTYLLTNLTAQERADWSNEGYDASGQNYQKGTNWISHQDGYWIIFAYDGTYLTDLYHDTSASLNATNSYDWTSDGDVTPAPITYCAQVALSNVFTVAAGGVAVVNISLQAMQTNYDMVETNGIHVTATAPVSVYAMDYDPAASAAFICYPTPLLGTNYCVLARDVGVTSAGYWPCLDLVDKCRVIV
jgi:hypothetical protein